MGTFPVHGTPAVRSTPGQCAYVLPTPHGWQSACAESFASHTSPQIVSTSSTQLLLQLFDAQLSPHTLAILSTHDDVHEGAHVLPVHAVATLSAHACVQLGVHVLPPHAEVIATRSAHACVQVVLHDFGAHLRPTASTHDWSQALPLSVQHDA